MQRLINHNCTRSQNARYRASHQPAHAGRSPMTSQLTLAVRRGGADRGGSVLIVVIGLLLILLLVGLAFFTFAGQEHSASEYYADSTKVYSDSPNADGLFEVGLEQLIIGPHEDNYQSSLYGGRYSLVPNMLGMFGGIDPKTGNFVGNPNDLPLDPSNKNARLRVTYPTVPTDRHPYNGGVALNIISGVYASGANKGQKNGAPVLDQNFNGIDDALDGLNNSYLLNNVNLSGAAQLSGNALALPNALGAGMNSRGNIYANFPATDVGYTYPDINNLFLAHIGIEPTNGNLTIVPSFFRPSLMRDSNGMILPNWYRDQFSTGYDTDSVTGIAIDTTTRLLQPHPGHVVVVWNSSVPLSPVNTATINLPVGGTATIPRYLTQPIVAGANNPYTNQPNPRSIQYYGFPSATPFTGNPTGSVINGQLGVYSNSNVTNLDYPVDNDNDGIPDSVWLDLGYPATTLMDGRKMIPLFSYLVLDADSLINLNSSGNVAKLGSLSRPLYGYAAGASSATTNWSISGSNYGTSRSEINPFWALVADPRSNVYLASANRDPSLTSGSYICGGPNNAFQAYRGVFGLSNLNSSTSNGYDVDRIEAANMDQLFLLWGRPNFTVTTNGSGQELFSINNITPGLWGDVANLLNGLSNGTFGLKPPQKLSLFPQPGVPNYDDNGNLLVGLTDAGYLFNGNVIGGDPALFQLPLPLQSPLGMTNLLYPTYANATAPLNSSLTVLPFSQPLDFTGGGQWTIPGTYGQVPALVQPNTNYPATYLRYNGYQGSYSATYPSPPLAPAYIPYQLVFPSSPSLPQSQYGLLSLNPITSGVIDEADERISDLTYATLTDQGFPVDETFATQADEIDYDSVGAQSRLRQLASWNFDVNLKAQVIRRHFTTISSDRRQHGFASAISPANINNTAYNPNNLTFNRFWEYASGNWDGTSPQATKSSPAGPFLQFPPMVLNTSFTNNATISGGGMDGLVPALVNNPGANNPLNTQAAEPFRMELAALIGAKLNDPVTFIDSNKNKYTPAAYQYRSSQNPSTPWQQQLRLNINRFLSAADSNSAFGSSIKQSQQNPLRYRELTPHPTSGQWTSANVDKSVTVTAAIPSLGSQLNSLPTNSFVNDATNFSTRPDIQEYWARRDRQQMARDIYVMLYMFGGGFESEDLNLNGKLDPGEDLNGNKLLDFYVDYATQVNQPASQASPTRPIYQDWQLYEMAQFAVNVVDSLDRDNVITVFEFDMDLSDGWNLDDNPYTTPEARAAFPNASSAADVWKAGDRGVVFGVEAQQLAFNEALVVVAPYVKKDPKGVVPDNSSVDHPATAWDDSKRDRTFTYLEMFNVGPYDLPLGNSNWQVMVLDPSKQASAPLNPPTSSAWTILTFTDANATASAGRPYTIGSYTYDAADPTTSGLASTGSQFIVDPSWSSAVTSPDPAFQTATKSQIIPGYNNTTSAFPNPNFDLDLVLSYGKSAGCTLTDSGYNTISVQGGFLDFTVGSPTATPTALAQVITGPFQGANYQATFVLRRRLNLDRPAPAIKAGNNAGADELDNPWIEVDRITYWNQTSPVDVANQPPPSNPAGAFFQLRSTQDSQLGGANNAALLDIQPKLARLQSRERRQPLDGFEGFSNGAAGGTTNPPTAAPAPLSVATTPTSTFNLTTGNSAVLTGNSRVYFDANGMPLGGSGVANAQYNTIGQTNYYTTNTLGGVFKLWQPHFDRDFASVMDLLSIPLYGPSSLTQSLAPPSTNGAVVINTLTTEAPLPANSGNYYLPLVAQAKFLRPQYPINIGSIFKAPSANYTPQFDNRWYRVLELLEVPPRENLQVENTLLSQYPWLFPQALQRTTGKMNPNTLRFGENLFALLDDPTVFDVTTYTPYGSPVNRDGYYKDAWSVVDTSENGGRNWWWQLQQARDGKDPSTGGLYLPGTPSSRPFRSLSHFDWAPAADGGNSGAPGPSSADDTLLRTLPYDVTNVALPNLDQRGLFEARSINDLASKSQAGGNSVDYYTRQRLLSKIAGNTTPRSNVFLVWMTVGFFEAYEAVPATATQSAVMQIGAQMQDQTPHRGFFVIDRSVLEDAWVPPSAQNNNTGYYDYSKFVKYRRTIQ
jgi:hypothetical protein